MRMTDYNKHTLSHPDIACTLASRPHRVTSHTSSLIKIDKEVTAGVSGHSRGWLEVRQAREEASAEILRE